MFKDEQEGGRGQGQIAGEEQHHRHLRHQWCQSHHHAQEGKGRKDVNIRVITIIIAIVLIIMILLIVLLR